jgi:hypothetical protein
LAGRECRILVYISWRSSAFSSYIHVFSQLFEALASSLMILIFSCFLRSLHVASPR